MIRNLQLSVSKNSAPNSSSPSSSGYVTVHLSPCFVQPRIITLWLQVCRGNNAAVTGQMRCVWMMQWMFVRLASGIVDEDIKTFRRKVGERELASALHHNECRKLITVSWHLNCSTCLLCQKSGPLCECEIVMTCLYTVRRVVRCVNEEWWWTCWIIRLTWWSSSSVLSSEYTVRLVNAAIELCQVDAVFHKIETDIHWRA